MSRNNNSYWVQLLFKLLGIINIQMKKSPRYCHVYKIYFALDSSHFAFQPDCGKISKQYVKTGLSSDQLNEEPLSFTRGEKRVQKIMKLMTDNKR